MHTEYTLLTGSNLGQREQLLDDARKLISLRLGPVLAYSYIYRSAPWGFEAEGFFLNQALKVSTHLLPLEVLAEIQDVEMALGRVRAGSGFYESRTIDIDIIHWSQGSVDCDVLKVPHPMLPYRRFALVPVVQIIPDDIHPVLNLSYRALNERCTDLSVVEPYFSQ